MTKKKFWVRPAIAALFSMCTGGVVLGWALSRQHAGAGLLGTGLIFFGWLLAGQAWRRWLGVHVERQAFKRLKLPAGWTAHHGYPSPLGGDIDVFIKSPGGQQWAVEVKSKRDVHSRRAFMGLGSRYLCDAQGRRLAPQDLRQAQDNAQAASARAVLWYPRAAGPSVQVEGCLVVLGDARRLRRAIGASWWW
jgi:hypothetical protein